MKAIFVESFLAPAEAEDLLAAGQALPWARGRFRGHAVPREEVWMGPYAYRFSGRTLEPTPWTPGIEAVREKIRAECGGDYNSVLLNRYVNERDSVSWHSDDEPEMDSEHTIASLSLGAPREFRVRAIDSRAIQSYALGSGSLLLMPAGFQQRYRHCLVKSKIACGCRVNLTFRRMKAAKRD